MDSKKSPPSTGMTGLSVHERRQYKRVRAPVYCRPMGIASRFLHQKAQPLDISLGGLRIYSDEPVNRGARLELELFLPDNTSVSCKVEVVWVDELPAEGPARHDVGLKFIEVRDEDRRRLATVLDDC